jgi:hypothetical protein
MHMSLAQWMFTIVGLALLVLLLVVMHVRKCRSDFPVFYNYVIFYAISLTALSLVVNGSYKQYFYSYWTQATLESLLGFFVLYEAFGQIMKPYSALTDLAKMIFLWVGVFLLAISLLTAVATTGSMSTKICTVIILVQRCVRLMQCGFLLLFVVFEKRLGVSWSARGMCVTVGLGLSAVLNLIVIYLMNTAPAWASTLTIMNNLVSDAIIAYWIVGMYAYQTVRKTAIDAPNRLVLQRWNEVLLSSGYGNRAPVLVATDSFIPGVEQVVDRVLARKAIH